MITARYEPNLFPRDRSPSPHLGASRRRCASQSTENDDIDRFIELAHDALEEATKEEDAKGVLRELLERFLARTGAPLMADVIGEQLRSQEIIEQLAEQSFERQHGKYIKQQQYIPASSVSTRQKKRLNDTSLSNRKHLSPHRQLGPTASSSLSFSLPSSLTTTTTPVTLPTASPIIIADLKDPHDPETIDEAVTRDQFIIQQSPSLHTRPDRLLLVSEYIWRLFRLLILASLVALVYHYVCTYPHQLFLIV
ncbi:hypothetical protein BCR42DRAFT_419916 [Absidia repens]|uniref:Uncharacterized protein n=1 Tax=Absidia repens TaxID=90262 RepID=A0A1X2IAH2_9FUNG|nr:hypothetical protein BCR42DRAFT_419916 [Absidia repens]